MGIPYTSSDRGATGKLRSSGLSFAVIDEASLYVELAVLQFQLFDLLARFCVRFVIEKLALSVGSSTIQSQQEEPTRTDLPRGLYAADQRIRMEDDGTSNCPIQYPPA